MSAQANAVCLLPHRRDHRLVMYASSDEFYRVALGCEAAPRIGCGIRAKPILIALEACDAIAGAWLNRSGTVIAVRWKSASIKNERLVAAAFNSEQCLCIQKVIDTKEHRQLAESLVFGDRWYRAEEVDRLSEEEASLIAARIVQRFTVNVALDPARKTKLERSITEACKRYLINERPDTAQTREEGVRKAILDVGSTLLTADHHNVLREALSSGHRPLPFER